MLTRPPHRLAGRPVTLPPAVDRIAEAWWRARPRTRALARVAAVLLVLAAGIAHAASSPDGPPTTVWVASRDLYPGERLTSSDVRRQTWPGALVPDHAVDDPSGTVSAPLPRGAVVTGLHLGDQGVAASVPDGQLAVAVPAEQLPTVAPGTRVDLVGAGPDGIGAQLAEDAVIVHADADSVWIAVDPAAAVRVSAAATSATLAAVVRPA